MRSFPYFIIAYVILGVQIGLGDLTSWHGARPNLVLLAVIFIAMHVTRDAALLGCFSLGLLQDLLSQHPPGLYAFAYGMVALLITGTQQAIYRNHPAAHVAVSLLGGLITAVVLMVYSLWRPGPKVIVDGAMVESRIGLWSLFLSAGYTALLAPVVLWALNRFRRIFAPHGYYRRGW